MNANYSYARKRERLGLAAVQKPRRRRSSKTVATSLFPQFCVSHGLPAPHSEYPGLVPGRKFVVDFLWERGIVVEVNGGVWAKGNSGHSSGAGILRDYEKSNLLQAEGFKVFTFTPQQLFEQATIDLLRKVLIG